jgi:ATP:corrinoid adenosyltransferase
MEKKSEMGLVHIYYGEGKGKTSIGMGMSIRAAGYGLKVLIYQFMKDNSSSEREGIKHVPGVLLKAGLNEEKFSFQMSEDEKIKRRIFYNSKLDEILVQVEQEKVDVLFLDEIIYTVRAGLLEESSVITFLKNKPVSLEVILTGNGDITKLIEYADYISEIKKIKHPYDKGTKARRGIEK